MKQCRICKQIKESSEFHKDKKAPDGLCRECKDCRTKISLEYIKAHKKEPKPRKQYTRTKPFTPRTTCRKCGAPITMGALCDNCKKKKPLRRCECGEILEKGKSLCSKCREFKQKNYYLERIRTKRDWVASALSGKRKQEYDITITIDELEEIANNTEYCPLCGCKLNYIGKTKHGIDYTASLDRINNEDTVTKDNTWIICMKCNATKSNRTLQEFIDYCKMISNYKIQ